MYNARIKLPARFTQADIEKLSTALEDIASAHVALREGHNDNAPWILEWVTTDQPDPADLSARLALMAEIGGLDLPVKQSDWAIAPLPDIDWLAESYRKFPAFSVGPFYIYGSHHNGDVPTGQMGLQIDAATAFGSGEHGTTKGCLQAMLDLKGQGVCPWNILDLGTGSGILAIAAWKLWKTPILAVDNDEEAVRVAKHHQQANKVPAGASDITCAYSDGFASDIVAQKKPYELIIANILAGPLRDMAPDLTATLDDNGYVILSGIVQEQADDVIAAYQAQGLTLKKRYDIGEWATLIMHKG